jgi:hypothetical protein
MLVSEVQNSDEMRFSAGEFFGGFFIAEGIERPEHSSKLPT